MACISRIPLCGQHSSSTSPFQSAASIWGTLIAILGGIISILGFFGKLALAGDHVVLNLIGSFSIPLSGFAVGLAGGVIGAALIVSLAASYASALCSPTAGIQECVSGAANRIVRSFDSLTDELVPFTAMHNRVDVVVRSIYWDTVESDAPGMVFCTGMPLPQNSEILRVYYFTPEVCAAALGSVAGSITAGVAGLIAAAIAAAAIGCATIFLCIFGLILAVLIGAAAALIGAFAGGQIAKNSSASSGPADGSGALISVGDLISVTGNMLQRSGDSNANVFWWETSTAMLGMMPSGLQPPFSYCDVNDNIGADTC